MSLIRIAIPFAALVPAALQAQPRWEQIWDEPDVAVIYVDRASAAGPSELRTIATRTVYRAPLPEGYISERIRTEEFDCVGHRVRIRQVTVLASDGRPPLIQDWRPGESQWSGVEAESLGAAKSEIACGGVQRSPSAR